K
ncbi:hypothetical protein ACTFIW_010984, partial [Dictyostelium discoideum]